MSGAATPPGCGHNVVVPSPGGFAMPAFCIPGTGYSVSVTQTGCGAGQIDSNGGADYSVAETGDTSDASATCDLPNPVCPLNPTPEDVVDGSARIDVTVGDASPDACDSGTANALLAVPVRASRCGKTEAASSIRVRQRTAPTIPTTAMS